MVLPVVHLLLTAMLQASLGQGHSVVVSKMTPKKQKEILDAFNAVRRNVKPTASNMLKMLCTVVPCKMKLILSKDPYIYECLTKRDFQQKCIETNPSVLERWSDEATETASRWVSQCQFRNSPIEERTVGDTACGETISQTVTASSWPDIIKQWARTKTNFKYGVGPVNPRKSIYTYTQLIWYNSYKVGCAVAYCPENTFPYLYLCHYCPSGNAQDKIATPYKAGLPCADCPHDCEKKLCTKACEYTNSYNQCASLKDSFSCESGFMTEVCKATCKCKTEIV